MCISFPCSIQIILESNSSYLPKNTMFIILTIFYGFGKLQTNIENGEDRRSKDESDCTRE